MSSSRRFPWWGGVGAAIFVAGLVVLVLDLPRWNTFWYVPAWWGYLLVLDAGTCRIRGGSFLSSRPREVAAMLFWSVPFWFLFEAYNLVIDNWYYVFALHDDRLQEVVAWLAFATVLPACFLHAELVKALGWFEKVRWPPLRVGAGVFIAMGILGWASIVLPLLWPRIAFPLVWGATLWLPAIINYATGAPSLLLDLELGRPGWLLQLLVGGLFAGLAWEALNYWARSKWIYTVPGFEDVKLFEMPVAGFLGFPVLALSAHAFYTAVSWWARGRSWRLGILALATRDRSRRDRLLGWVAVLLAALFSHVTYGEVLEHTVVSRRPLLRGIESLGPEGVRALREHGIETPERMIDRSRARGVTELARRTGIRAGRLVTALETAELSLHKGMGTVAAERLREIGVESVDEVAEADPEVLWRRLSAQPREPGEGRDISLAEVRVWVRAARLADGPRR